MVGENMLFIYGLLSAVVFFVSVSITFYIGFRLGSNFKKPQKVDKEQIKQAEKLQKDFQKLFNYDVTTALQRKKVE